MSGSLSSEEAMIVSHKPSKERQTPYFGPRAQGRRERLDLGSEW